MCGVLLAGCGGAPPASTAVPTAPPPTTTVATSAPATVGAEPVASGPQVSLAYVGPGVGVVGTSPAGGSGGAVHLYLTRDFSRWFDVTPRQLVFDGGGFEGASFVDPTHGWVSAFNAATATSSVYRTTDGGGSWLKVATTTHTMNAGAVTRVQFLSSSLGFMDIEQPTGPVAELRVTTDDGDHWAVRAAAHNLPVADVWFVDATHAVASMPPWLCLDGPDAGVWWSADGGVSWTHSALPTQAAADGMATCLGVPTVTARPGVLLPFTTVADTGSRVGFLLSRDTGRSWEVAGILPTIFNPGHGDFHGGPGAPVGAVAPDGSWWIAGVRPTGSAGIAISSDQGAHWRTAAGRGLVGQPLRLFARGARSAWALVLDGANSRLFATIDAGDTWVPVAPAHVG